MSRATYNHQLNHPFSKEQGEADEIVYPSHNLSEELSCLPATIPNTFPPPYTPLYGTALQTFLSTKIHPLSHLLLLQERLRGQNPPVTSQGYDFPHLFDQGLVVLVDLCHGIEGGVVGQQPSIQETANGPEISGSCTTAAGSTPHELLCKGQRAKGLLQQLCCAQKAPKLYQHRSGWFAILGNPALHGCASFSQQQGFCLDAQDDSVGL